MLSSAPSQSSRVFGHGQSTTVCVSSALRILRDSGPRPLPVLGPSHLEAGPSVWGGHSPLLRCNPTPLVTCHASSSSVSSSKAPSDGGNGVFFLILANVLVFIADHILHLPGLRSTLYLHHAAPEWWQFLTHAFCHGSLAHLSGNMFNLLVFGKMVEETEGELGVIVIYILTALGAAGASFFLSGRNAISVGASGAVFGLFATSVLLRLMSGLNLKRLLEAAILGNFVIRQVLDEVQHQLAGGLSMGGMSVAHVAHLGGALAGVLLVWFFSRLPPE